MSIAEEMVPETEVVKRERAAFRLGAGWFYSNSEVPGHLHPLLATAEKVAVVRYPLPTVTVTRPRVLEDEYGCEWRLVHGHIEWRGLGQPWGDKLARESVSLTITQRRAEVIATLVANPTETVEVEP
jgi:hypothetical protein